MKKKLILICGLQKSGTTLLFRLLNDTGIMLTPFGTESRKLWGDHPPGSPVGYPFGKIYQKHNGTHGHCIGSHEVTALMKIWLHTQVLSRHRCGKIILSKTPYNAVRIPSLRTLFPEACIVAVIRDPLPNVYSIMKKYHPDNRHTVIPQDGWWGVKPRNWQALLHDDKLVQTAQQWVAVNKQILEDVALVDHLVRYEDLCRDSFSQIRAILSGFGGYDEKIIRPHKLRVLNDEHVKGGALLSNNQLFRQAGSFDIPERQTVAVQPFSNEQIETVLNICDETHTRLKSQS